jgi:hypothetical protein
MKKRFIKVITNKLLTNLALNYSKSWIIMRS